MSVLPWAIPPVRRTITIKALADPEQYSYCRPIVVGDVKVMEQAKKFVGREDIVIHRCEKVSDALFTPGTIDVLHLDLIEDISKFEIAKVSVEGGNAAFQCVKRSLSLLWPVRWMPPAPTP